ncbi:lipase [Rhizoctonia solani AG-1 IA]|uniref:triacylglycerol lipase n=1 Tax=Thanatephorus cucumeris (strain AG1-IA) TaxID=983506 RepID=L8X4C2_THACA|nr:lipase [Rhizoctonia solani AG-1 IA]
MRPAFVVLDKRRLGRLDVTNPRAKLSTFRLLKLSHNQRRPPMHSRLCLTFLFTVFSYTAAASIPNHLSFTPVGSSSDTQTVFSKPHVLRTRTQTVYQPRSIDDIYRARDRSLRLQESEPIEWVTKKVLAPDVTDRETLRELAKMTANAYAKRGNGYGGSLYLLGVWCGWLNPDQSIKGTRFVIFQSTRILAHGISVFGRRSGIRHQRNPGQTKRQSLDWTWQWQTVCDCYSGHNRCDQTCLSASLVLDSLFYNVGLGLYANLTAMYPGANIWLTGHSLGGSLAALLGATFGVPTVTFESPGERLASTRLHIPSPPGMPSSDHPITHVWHTGDPIPDGRCVGPTSLCAKAGYALETRCRNGKHIVYDTVTRKKWAPSIAKHRIGIIINDVLGEDWEEDRAVPEAVPYDDCEECGKWEFGDYLSPDAYRAVP